MRKSHPFRRVVLATAATVSGVVLLLSLKPGSDPAAASVAGTAPRQTAAGQASPQGGARASGGSGTVTGEAVPTRYGTVQVRLTVSNGKITRAEAVQAPKGGLSDQKTAMAVPKLDQEAVAAQSARIDAVSGATYTSAGYKKSLQSALDNLKPASSGTSESSGSSGSSGSAGSTAAAQAGAITGEMVRTQYGPIQVRITVRSGRPATAEAVQAPKGGLSDQKTEAVAAGSAHIDAVSGATCTGSGYRQSLQSALDRAGG